MVAAVGLAFPQNTRESSRAYDVDGLLRKDRRAVACCRAALAAGARASPGREANSFAAQFLIVTNGSSDPIRSRIR